MFKSIENFRALPYTVSYPDPTYPRVFLQLVSHVTALKLQSDWSTQIPFLGPKIVSIFTRPLLPPSLRVHVFSRAGHFPWIMPLVNPILAYTEGGKALKYVLKAAKDLVQTRRETGQTGKVKHPQRFPCSPRCQCFHFSPCSYCSPCFQCSTCKADYNYFILYNVHSLRTSCN